MLFCIFNWHKIEGIGLVLTGCVLCLTAFSILTENWTRKGLKRAGIAMLACEMSCSMVWQLLFFPGGNYRNYGLQGGLLFLLYPALLAAAWAILALYPKIRAKRRRRKKE